MPDPVIYIERNTMDKGDNGEPAVITYRLMAEYDFGTKEIERYLNYDTPQERVAVTEYFTDLQDYGYGQVAFESSFDGNWTRYAYDAAGRVIKTVSGFADAVPEDAENLCVVTLYDYTYLDQDEFWDGEDDDNRWRTKITETLGVETSREYRLFFEFEEHEITAAYAEGDYDDPDNLVRKTFYDSEKRVIREENYDGTYSETTYSVDLETEDIQTITERGFGSTPLRSETVITDANKYELSREVTDIASDLVIEAVDTENDSFGRPQRQVTIDGQITTREYDTDGLRKQITPDGMVTEYAYDIFRRRLYESNSGVTTYYAYDGTDNLISQTIFGKVYGELTSMNFYSEDGQNESSVDAIGAETLYRQGTGWDEVEDALGTVRRTEYYRDGRVKRTLVNNVVTGYFVYTVEEDKLVTIGYTDVNSNEWNKSYTDFLGREYKTTYPDDYERESHYDSLGRIIREEDTAGNVTTYSYDETTGELIEQTTNGVTSQFKTGWREREGKVVNFRETYLPFNNTFVLQTRTETSRDGLSSWTWNAGRETHTARTYEGDGEVLETITNFDSSWTRNRYLNGLLQSSETRLLGETTYHYDEFNRATGYEKIENNLPLSVIYTLDNAGRRTYIKLEGSGMLREFSYEYDALGRTVSETTQEGLVTHYTYNAAGQVSTVSGAVYWQSYQYDPQGRVTHLTTRTSEQEQKITSFEYDNRGRLAKKIYPDNNFETYTYFGDGRLETATNCRNQEIELTYDQFNNLASLSAATIEQEFEYNERNQLIKITDEENYSHCLSYNAFGRLEFESFSDIPNTELRYVYDDLLRRQSVCFAGRYVNYSYDTISRLFNVDYNGKLFFHYTRVPGNNKISQITAAKRGEILYEQPRTYNPLGDLLSIGDTDYTVNGDGIRTGATLPDDKTWAYTYDTQNQISTGELTDGTTTIFNQSYSYDQMGNHLGASFLRDADGNTLDVNGYTCTYDALNRLSTLTQNRVKFKLKYDYSSRLIKLEKYTGTTLDYTDRYVYDGWNLLATYRDGALVKFYTWGEDLSGTMTGAGGVGGLLAEDNEAGIFLPQYDGNGNIISYLDSDGEIAASYTYDPFGNILTSSGDMADDFTFRFSTKPLMPFNLYYYGYRFYNSTTCTWLTRDPMTESGGVNLHAFVVNNAVNQWDYLGLKWTIERKGDNWAAAKRESITEDTIIALADKVQLDIEEVTKWLKTSDGKNVTQKDMDISCNFRVPNTMVVYTSKSRWLTRTILADNIISMVTIFKRRAVAMGEAYENKGYKLVVHKWAADWSLFNSLWATDGIAAFAFAGHGGEDGGFVTEEKDMPEVFSYNVGVIIPYKLQAVYAYACYSAAAPTRQTGWKSIVSTFGTYVLYTGKENYITVYLRSPITQNPGMIP